MSMSTANQAGGGSAESISRYMNSSSVTGNPTLPDRRRRGKNMGGNYYGNGPRSDSGGSRYPPGGNGYQRNHRGTGGSGDGPHHQRGEYDIQSHSPTDSHGSSRSAPHHQGQGTMGHSGGQQHHYHQQQHGSQHHHQYHQKQDYESSRGSQDYRSQRGGGVGDQHHGHSSQHHHHNNSHYGGHNHHRSNMPPQQQHHEVVSSHTSQNSHAVGTYTGGNGNTGAIGHQPVGNTSTSATTTEIAEHTFSTPSNNGNGGSHYQQQSGPTAVIQQFHSAAPPACQTSMQGPATVGFYGYHPNSQPMFGSLALCHIPYGVNPASVISPLVYTQIIGSSGLLTPGLPYNLACGIPPPYMQPNPGAAPPVILQPPHHPQQYPVPPQYHQHYHAHPSHYAGGLVGGQAMTNASTVPGCLSHQQAPHHHSQAPQSHQSGEGEATSSAIVEAADEDCVLFDSSSLLNPDADAFFPPAFPPNTEGEEATETNLGTETESVTVNEEEPIVVVDDDDEDDLDPVDAKHTTGECQEESADVGTKQSDEIEEEEEDADDERDEDQEIQEKVNISDTGSSYNTVGAGDESN